MERRVLLAIFLAFLVLYTWQALFVKPVPKPAAGQGAKTTAPAATGSSQNAASTSPAPAPSAEAATPPAAVESKPPAPAATPPGATARRGGPSQTRHVCARLTH